MPSSLAVSEASPGLAPSQESLPEAPPQPGAYRHFEGMCWPVPGERLDELERALRFRDNDAVFSMSERMVMASFLSAYRELVALPAQARDSRVRELRKGPKLGYGVLPVSGDS